MAEQHRAVTEIAEACGVEPAAVCQAAYRHGVRVWFDATGKCAAIPQQPSPSGPVPIPQRERDADAAGSADAVTIATTGLGKVYLRLWRAQAAVSEDSIAALAAGFPQAKDGDSDGDDGPDAVTPEAAAKAVASADVRQWLADVGKPDRDAFVVDPRVDAAKFGREALVRLGDLRIDSRGVALLGAREGWTVDAPPPSVKLPDGLTWQAVAALFDPHHANRAPELQTAALAWMQLRRDGDGKANAAVVKFAKARGHSPDAAKRIGTVTNPERRAKGGAPKTPG